MNIKTAVQMSLNSPGAGGGGAVGSGPRSSVADTLKGLLDGVAEIERHVRHTDPRNLALFNRLMALKAELNGALAASEEQGRARLGGALRGRATGTAGGSSGSGPF